MNVYYTRAILASRTTVHLSWRLVYRAASLLQVSGLATAGAGFWRWMLPVFVLADIAQWQVLKRTDRLGLGWRVVADAADIAFWSLSPLPPDGTYDAAVLIGVPLAAEAGVRLGWRSLSVPACELAIVGAVRSVAGEPVLPFTFLWAVLAVGVGWTLNAYCRRLHAEGERQRAQVRDAERRRAFVAGQNSIAMGASSVVDALQGLVPVLGRPEERSALGRLAAGWKAELGEATRSEVVYLRDALGEWERRHNQHPDLSSRAELHVVEGHGTVLLTARQAEWLFEWLDAAPMCGAMRASVGGEAMLHPPGAPVQVHIGPRTGTIPADKDVVARPVDPGPVTFIFAAGQCLTLLPPGGLAVPWMVAAGLIALCLGAALWAHHRLLRFGKAARALVLRAGLAIAVVLTVVGAAYAQNGLMRNRETAYAGVGLILLGYLAGLYWYGMTRRLKAEAVGAALACLAAAFVLAPGPHQARSFVTMAAANLVTFPTCRRISIELTRAGEQYAAQAQDDDRATVQQAFLKGRDSVLDLARKAHRDAHGQLAAIGTALDPGLAGVVSTRLEEVDRRLRSLSSGCASSSSTITS